MDKTSHELTIPKLQNELKVVDNVWNDFLLEFENGELVHDQILIITEELFLRGPNFDLMQVLQADNHVH